MMKRSLHLGLGCYVGVAVFALANGLLKAQTPLDLTFDASQLGNPDYNNNNLYVTFSGQELSATLGSTDITLINNKVPSTSSLLTQSFSLAQIEAAGGLTINSAQSVVAYISYGSDTDFNLATIAPSPVTEPTRFSNFEFTYNPSSNPTVDTTPTNSGGGADTTYINSFGGGLNLTSYTSTTETPANLQGSVTIAPGVTSAAIFQSMAANINDAGNGGNPGVLTAVQKAGPSAGQTIYNRVVMASTYGTDIGSGKNTAYPSFQAYVDNLAANSGNGATSVATLSLLPTNMGGTGPGTLAYDYTGSDKPGHGGSYALTYNNFTAAINKGTDGSYTITMNGTVTATPNPGNTSPTITYNNLTITVTLANAAALNAFIYEQITPANNIAGVTFSQSGAGWAQLASDFSALGNGFYYRIPNDLTEGLLIGAVGSTVASGIDGKTIGELNSAQWWANPELTYANAQPGSPDYNAVAAYLWTHSSSFNSNGQGATLEGGLYVNPFDDRFGTNLLKLNATGLPDLTATAALNVSLIPDGDLTLSSEQGTGPSVPEPGTWTLLGLGIGALVFLNRRRCA